MRVIQSIAAMQRASAAWRRSGRRSALVPTMGFLHEGHASLMSVARRRVGTAGAVVVSIYVNPTQFAASEDLSRYPRDHPRDLRMCRGEGVDAVFLPTDATMYPGRETGGYSTYVQEEQLSQGMEGASRPGHFRGVTTVVAKLFLATGPDLAVFGAKDWQQAAVVRRMTSDLNFPVRIVVAPTRREPDGLAMSSRNSYLSAGERSQATVLWECLDECRRAVACGPVTTGVLRRRVAARIARCPDARLDYVAFFEGNTLVPVTRAARGSHMALAVFVGRTRLIDNGVL